MLIFSIFIKIVLIPFGFELESELRKCCSGKVYGCFLFGQNLVLLRNLVD